MVLKNFFALYIILFSLASLNANPVTFSQDNVKIELPSSLSINQTKELNISYTLPSGYYTTANNPFIKLTSQQNGVSLGKVKFISHAVDGKHSGILQFKQAITVNENINKEGLKLIASYQLCDVNGVCFLPQSLELEPIAISLEKPTIAWEDLVWFLFLAYVGGLLLNFMPCVLPVVMLKVYSVIGLKNSGEHMSYMLSYSAGLLIGSLGLATGLIVLKSLGYAMGWGFHWQNGYFVLGMFVLLFLIILNLLDILSFKIGFMGGKNSSALVQGFFTLLLSTPCSAPFLGMAMVWLIDKPASVVLLAFTLIAMGLLTPFWLLPLLPTKWQDIFSKQRYLASFLKYGAILSLVLVLRWLLSFLLPSLYLAYFIIGLGGVGLACYLLGRSLSKLKWLALMLLLVSFYSLYGSYKPNSPATVVIEAPWQPYSASKVEKDLAQHRPVFVSFTALWCLSCRYNDYMVLQNSELLAFFKANGVALYKADLTYNTSADAGALLAKIGRNSLPSYALYRADGKLEGIGNLISKNKIMDYYQ